jgi:hypothetical protein
MTLARDLVRTIVPPVLALGFAALVVHPMEPVVVATTTSAARSAAASTASYAGGGAALASTGVTTPAMRSTGTAQTVSVVVPPVVFVADIHAPRAAVHTPVLLTDPTVTGRASITPGNRCGVDLVQGKVAWVTCSVQTGAHVQVRLSDGRVYDAPVTLG